MGLSLSPSRHFYCNRTPCLGTPTGFDIRGDVKVFDFGLCKSLSSKLKARDGGYGYRLTGRAGSLPYMAPEVVRMETYDTKVKKQNRCCWQENRA